MLDYVSRENNVPLCTKYESLRKVRLETTLYPSSVLVMSIVNGERNIKGDALSRSIPEFLRHNIVENEVRNVV
jgi:hypothetical protein